MLRTLPGPSSSDRLLKSTWRSLRRIAAIAREPSAGTRWSRSALSVIRSPASLAMSDSSHFFAYFSNVIRPACGSTYWPVTMLAVTSSIQR
jgi:hypothetical protein